MSSKSLSLCRFPFLSALVLTVLPAVAIDTVLVESDPPAAASALVPSVANGGSTLAVADWTTVAEPPNAASWIAGTTGIGFEGSPSSATSYTSLIGIDLAGQMQNTSTSAYIRVPFTIDQPTLDSTLGLWLDMNYDDGFIAYLNGVPIASANPPAGAPNYQSGASGDNPDGDALAGESFDVSAHLGLLVAGDNMLAIHGLNNGTASSDFLILPQLVASDVAPPVPPEWPDLQLGTPVISGLASPVDIAPAGDGSRRLFIVERAGRVRIWDGRGLRPFLDIASRVNTSDVGGDERGLLGIAFPPDFASKGYFYLNYISNAAGRNGDTVLSRFMVNPANPNDALETSEEILLVVDQPESNHNGGQIHFGKDGYLYLGLGDGGGGGDQHGTIGNGQAESALLGKMLRLDVEGPPDPGSPYAIPSDNPFITDPEVPDEVWAFGLRNPWRWSFDRKTGDMFIADVGQGAREEVNFAPASSTGAENYQWRRLEGFANFNTGTPLTKGVSTDPIHDYGRGDGTSITGGYVYRGGEFPRMDGIYFFGDYNSGRLWGLAPDSSGAWLHTEFIDTSLRISCFGEDESGSLYVASLSSGEVYELTDTRNASYLQITGASFDPQGSAEVTFGAEIGRRYQLQFSTDLQAWQDLGAPQTAAGLALTLSATLDPPVPPHAYFRVVELEG